MADCPPECSVTAFQKHTAALYYIVFAHEFQSQLETSSPAPGYSGKPAGRQVLRLHLEDCLGPAKDRPQALCTLHLTSETAGVVFLLLLIPLEEITFDRLSPSVSGTEFYLKLDSGSPYLKPRENSGSSLIFKGSRAHLACLNKTSFRDVKPRLLQPGSLRHSWCRTFRSLKGWN